MKSRKAIYREALELFRLCFADGLMDEDRVKTVVGSLAHAVRHDRFELLRQFRRLVYLECKRRTAVVESATPLPAPLAAKVQARLSLAYGQGLAVTFSQTPGLIGGMRIQVGSDVYDGSVRGRLAALAAQM